MPRPYDLPMIDRRTDGENAPRADDREEREMSARTLTPKEIAQEWEVSPKTLRKFLRTEARDAGVETPGKGGRWAIPASTTRSLKRRFDAWIAENAKAKEEVLDEAETPDEVEVLDAPETDDAVEVLDTVIED
jgi:hypothetical protein